MLNARPRPSVVRRDGAVALVDGDQGPGQLAGILATDLTIELAREHGVGVVAVRRSAHFGAAAYYSRRAAAAGLIGISMTNSEPSVIPYGGLEPALGTNPISLAAPAGDERGGIFDLDLATSQVALNRIYNAADEGRAIPEGWGVDAEGRPTTDPAAVLAGVPLGGYKGYVLAVLVEILCGVLPGAGVTHSVGEHDVGQDVGHFHLAIDPEPHGRPRPLRGRARRAGRRAAREPGRARPRRGARAGRPRGSAPAPCASVTACRSCRRCGRPSTRSATSSASRDRADDRPNPRRVCPEVRPEFSPSPDVLQLGSISDGAGH